MKINITKIQFKVIKIIGGNHKREEYFVKVLSGSIGSNGSGYISTIWQFSLY
jgi:hypothetical protein